jgi:hypothetical protein
VDESVLSLCHFEVGNLLEVARPGSALLSGVDLVLCRHVLIYFRPDEAAAVVEGLVQALDPGAALILAPVEAHLATGLAGLEPLGTVGAFRRVAARARPAAARRPSAASRFRGRPSPLAVAPLRQEAPPSRHARAALEHTAAGRSAEALREARAACFLDPWQLLSRLVLGRELMAVDQRRGRAVLAELVELACGMPAESAVPNAPGLSVGQVTSAALLLMKRGDRP